MMRRMMLAVLLAALVLTAMPGHGTDGLDGCLDELRKLQEVSGNAAGIGRTAKAATDDSDGTRDRARQQCAVWGDSSESCARAQAGYRSQLGDVERKRLDFRASYVSVEARISGVQAACSADGRFPVISGVRTTNVHACLILQSFRDAPIGLIPTLNRNCREMSLSEDECRVCLAENYRPK
jgi:hypothetical protein